MAALLKKRALAEYSQVIQEPPRPLKRLRIVKKVSTGGSAFVFVGLLEKNKGSNDALQILLRISDTMKFQEDELAEAVRKLSDHFQQEQESAVRAKILSLFGDMGKETGADIQAIIEEIILLLKKETSHKVLAQGLSALLRLGRLLPDNPSLHHRLVQVAKQYLSDTSHLVKCKCLELIGELHPFGTVGEASAQASTQAILRLVGDYMHSEEARVRSAAFRTMINFHKRGLRLDPALYSEVCLALKDDYEIVRQAALQLVWILGQTYPENLVQVPDSEEQLRMVDDSFSKLCIMINDLSMRVRTQAARGLGSMTLVSPRFLQQTLDKKLMSNMRKKRSAHERAWESVTSGEWSSGKNWADDAPRELVDAESVSLISTGSCGAFVHGLEDEFLEVRNASVESLCQLAMHNPHFAAMSLDFLVDMFNDEIEEVRLRAIDCLTRISRHCLLREDQLETILGALKDFSIDVREGLHKMLGACRLSSKGCLQMCVESLLDNLRKYPVDRKSTWRCLQRIGEAHPELTLALVPELLSIHPFLDMPEVDVEEPSYVSMLILVFNAAQHCPTMLQLFEESTLKHYCYLRDTMPNLVPALKLDRSSVRPDTEGGAGAGAAGAARFLDSVLARLAQLEPATPPSSPDTPLPPQPPVGARLREELLRAAQRDLERVATIDCASSGAARFAALFVAAQLEAATVLAQRPWAAPAALAAQQGHAARAAVAQLINKCLQLQHLFLGLGEREASAVRQFRLLAAALQLAVVARGSSGSARALCDAFLEQCDEAARLASERPHQPLEPFVAALLRALNQLEDTKPGPVARALLPLLQAATPSPPPRPSPNVRMTTAVISEPTGEADTPLKFTAGLVMGVPLDAEIRHLRDSRALRIKVKYPDQQTQLLVPKRSDLRPLESDQPSEEPAPGPAPSLSVDGVFGDSGSSATASASAAATDFRLLTTVLISHQVWTEACTVEVSLALDVTEKEAGMLGLPGAGRRGSVLLPLSSAGRPDLEPCVLDLCKPVKVYVAPKPIKRGI